MSIGRDAIVAPDGCHVAAVTLKATWAAWERIVEDLQSRDVVSDTDISVYDGTVGSWVTAYAHYTDAGVTVTLASPTLDFNEAGEPVLPEPAEVGS